jgi:four helix bundle protein
MNQLSFNEKYRRRTKLLAIQVLKLYEELPKNEITRIIGRQLIRSVTSVGANFRATCQARSEKERLAKFGIVMEEADETLYWLELLEESHLKINVPVEIQKEANELTKVFSSTRKTLKVKLKK